MDSRYGIPDVIDGSEMLSNRRAQASAQDYLQFHPVGVARVVCNACHGDHQRANNPEAAGGAAAAAGERHEYNSTSCRFHLNAECAGRSGVGQRWMPAEDPAGLIRLPQDQPIHDYHQRIPANQSAALPDIVNSHEVPPPYDDPVPMQLIQQHPALHQDLIGSREYHCDYRHHQMIARLENNGRKPCCSLPSFCSQECCRACFRFMATFRWILISATVFALCFVIAGVSLGVIQMTSGHNYLIHSITLIGLGLILILVIGIGWRCRPLGDEPCQLLFNLTGITPVSASGRYMRTVNRRSNRQCNHRDCNTTSPAYHAEFQNRCPPPSYSASLQIYQNHTQHLFAQPAAVFGQPGPAFGQPGYVFGQPGSSIGQPGSSIGQPDQGLLRSPPPANRATVRPVEEALPKFSTAANDIHSRPSPTNRANNHLRSSPTYRVHLLDHHNLLDHRSDSTETDARSVDNNRRHKSQVVRLWKRQQKRQNWVNPPNAYKIRNTGVGYRQGTSVDVCSCRFVEPAVCPIMQDGQVTNAWSVGPAES